MTSLPNRPERPLIALVLLAALLLAGCADRTDTPTTGYAPVARLEADLLVRVAAPDTEALTFAVAVWIDGPKARLSATRLDHPVCEISLDGQNVTMYAPRSGLTAQTTLAAAPDLAGELLCLVSELRDGPFPPGPLVPAATAGWFQAGAGVITLAEDGSPSEKRLPGLVLRYERPLLVGSLRRSGRVIITGTQPGEVRVSLRRFQPMNAVAAERLRLPIPADAVAVTPEVLLERLER